MAKNKENKRQNSDFAVSIVMDDKLDSAGITLLSDQYKYIKTLKDQNEEKR